MNKVLTVTKIEHSDGHKPHRVVCSDKNSYSTFKDEVIEGLRPGLKIEADVTEKANGQYTNRYLNSWNFVAAEAAPAESATASVPSGGTDWDAKDRAISMQSCISSAAQFWQNRLTPSEDGIERDTHAMKKLAAELYEMVQHARAGQPVLAPTVDEVFPQ